MAMTVNQAIRALRKQSGKTQQVFATQLGISLRAYQKYEQRHLPELKQLLIFQRAAQAAGRLDLAGVFHIAVEEAAATDGIAALVNGYVGRNGQWKVQLVPFNEFERVAVNALLNCLRGRYQPAERKVIDAMCTAIPDPEDAQWFEEEALRQKLIKPRRAR